MTGRHRRSCLSPGKPAPIRSSPRSAGDSRDCLRPVGGSCSRRCGSLLLWFRHRELIIVLLELPRLAVLDYFSSSFESPSSDLLLRATPRASPKDTPQASPSARLCSATPMGAPRIIPMKSPSIILFEPLEPPVSLSFFMVSFHPFVSLHIRRQCAPPLPGRGTGTGRGRTSRHSVPPPIGPLCTNRSHVGLFLLCHEMMTELSSLSVETRIIPPTS